MSDATNRVGRSPAQPAADHSHSKLNAGIVGVSGYSGMELARILAVHPAFVLSAVTTDKWQGKRLGQ
ncbi:MAG TPA: hypothetical protein VIM14_05905, partial [Polyangia bacterium]